MPETKSSAPPRDVNSLHAILRDTSTALPKRLRECADLILENHDKIAVSTLAELTNGTAIQPSAFVRLCKTLGFSGYSELQKLYRVDFGGSTSKYSERLSRLGPYNEDSQLRLWGDFLEAGHHSVQDLIATIPTEILFDAVRMVAGARMVHLAGIRRAYPVSCHLAYTLDRLGIAVIQHDGSKQASLDSTMAEGDVLIATTFAPYASETSDLACQAKAKGLSVVAITDLAGRGLSSVADISLQVRDRNVGEFRSLSASITLATALAVLVAQERQGEK